MMEKRQWWSDYFGMDGYGPVDFAWTDLSGTNFVGAHLRGTVLSKTDLRDTGFSKAELSSANPSSASLNIADLSNVRQDSCFAVRLRDEDARPCVDRFFDA
jgi:uncharacterized protein YjbI with pentapeptide repeats